MENGKLTIIIKKNLNFAVYQKNLWEKLLH